MNKVLDIALGWPGLIVFVILIFAGVVATPNENTSRKQCEAQGGKWVQTMKTYHTCKLPQAPK